MQTNPMMAQEEARIGAIYDAIQGGLNWKNLVPTVLTAARVLETMPGLTGPEKLALLQKVLKDILRDSSIPMLEKEDVLHYIDTIVPIAAQAIVLVFKNPFVQEVEAACIGCWTKK